MNEYDVKSDFGNHHAPRCCGDITKFYMHVGIPVDRGGGGGGGAMLQ